MAGYVRLRCVDLIKGVTRHNTYENIYRSLPPLDEAEFDPMLDPRPLHKSGDDEETSKDKISSRNYGDRLTLPNDPLRNSLFPEKPTANYLQLRRNSDSMRKIITSSKDGKADSAFKLLKEKLAGIDEESDDDDDSERKENKVEEVVEDNSNKEDTMEDNDSNSSVPKLHSNIKTECFISRRLRIRSMKDVYDLKSTESENRLYLSSERYRETFEDDFNGLLRTIGEERLEDCVHAQDSVVVTKDLYKESVSDDMG